jgi:hypothetical protein
MRTDIVENTKTSKLNNGIYFVPPAKIADKLGPPAARSRRR